MTLIHRRDQFRASKIMLDRAKQNDKIHFLTDTMVEEVNDVSKREVTNLKLRNLKTDKVWDLPASAMFLGIGHIPNAKMFEGQLDTDQDGYLVTTKYVHHARARRLCLWRCAGSPLPAGHHRCGHRLHGSARGRAISGRAGPITGGNIGVEFQTAQPETSQLR